MFKFLVTFFVSFISIAVHAQDTTKVVRVRERVVGPTYSGDKVHTYFNGIRTSGNIASLIKTTLPSEIKKSDDKTYITITVSAPP